VGVVVGGERLDRVAGHRSPDVLGSGRRLDNDAGVLVVHGADVPGVGGLAAPRLSDR